MYFGGTILSYIRHHVKGNASWHLKGLWMEYSLLSDVVMSRNQVRISSYHFWQVGHRSWHLPLTACPVHYTRYQVSRGEYSHYGWNNTIFSSTLHPSSLIPLFVRISENIKFYTSLLREVQVVRWSQVESQFSKGIKFHTCLLGVCNRKWRIC